MRLSIYKRDEVFPEWEPIPWDLKGAQADLQEAGFHRRAEKPLTWVKIAWGSFPAEGIFGRHREWFASNEIEYCTTFEDEDYLLIRNTWHGFPDPPEWGLASRPSGKTDDAWQGWGHFPTLPPAWTVPE